MRLCLDLELFCALPDSFMADSRIEPIPPSLTEKILAPSSALLKTPSVTRADEDAYDAALRRALEVSLQESEASRAGKVEKSEDVAEQRSNGRPAFERVMSFLSLQLLLELSGQQIWQAVEAINSRKIHQMIRGIIDAQMRKDQLLKQGPLPCSTMKIPSLILKWTESLCNSGVPPKSRNLPVRRQRYELLHLSHQASLHTPERLQYLEARSLQMKIILGFTIVFQHPLQKSS